MVLAHYGHRLVALYNTRHGAAHTAASFFDEVAFPVLFGHPAFLLSVSNSPFFGAMKRAGKGKPVPEALRLEALADLHRKASDEPPDGSFVVGYPAAGADGVTSGLVSGNDVPLSRDDVFATWVGAALAVTVSGGYSLLFDDDAVLWTTFEGWADYRRIVNNPDLDSLKALQLPTWNAWHLAHRFGGVPPLPGTLPDLKKKTVNGVTSIETLGWANLVLALARRVRAPTPVAYVFSLGNTNTTIGFLPVRLDGIRVLYDLQQRYFANDAALASADLTTLYESDTGFRAACERGAIGLQAMRPAGLAPLLSGAALPNPAKNPALFSLHQLWILAMLPDRATLYELARATAADLVAFTAKGRGTERSNLITKELFGARGRRFEGFVSVLTKIVETDRERFAALDRLAGTVDRLKSDTFRLFVTLLAFQYAGQSRAATGATAADDADDSNDDAE